MSFFLSHIDAEWKATKQCYISCADKSTIRPSALSVTDISQFEGGIKEWTKLQQLAYFWIWVSYLQIHFDSFFHLLGQLTIPFLLN